MPQFIYTAKGPGGETESDTMNAPSRETVGQILRDKGLLPTSIEQKKEVKFSMDKLKSMIQHVSLLEKLTFVKNLAVTLRAGLPVSKALKVVTEQMPNEHFQKVVGDIAHRVETGQTLSDGLKHYPKIFSPMFYNMVKVGEESGELDKTLEYLASQVSRDYNLIRKTKGALIYPGVVLFALIVIGYLMFTFVLPRLTETFVDFGVELPFLTKVIIAVVDIFSTYSALVAIILISSAVGFWYWKKTVPGMYVVHKINLKIPIIGKLVKKVNLARFTLIFSSLLKSGMPIVEALKITSETMSNVYYRDSLKESSEKVKIGIDLRTSLERHTDLYPPMVTQMIRVGEESGTMEEVLAEVSHFYENEIDDSVKNLSSIIEPVLVIVIGAVVGVLAVGLIMPIYNLGAGI